MSAMHINHWDSLLKGGTPLCRALFSWFFVSSGAYIGVNAININIHHYIQDGSG